MRASITGRLVTGRGEAVAFTQVDWARRQFIAKLGIDPFPGTVNLVLDDPAELAKWSGIKRLPGIVMVSPQPDWCNGRCYRVNIAGEIAGAIVLPDVPDYPAAQVEVIAAIGVRDALGIVDGDSLTIELLNPAEDDR